VAAGQRQQFYSGVGIVKYVISVPLPRDLRAEHIRIWYILLLYTTTAPAVEGTREIFIAHEEPWTQWCGGLATRKVEMVCQQRRTTKTAPTQSAGKYHARLWLFGIRGHGSP
jgi:hypothetical protein